MRHIFWTLFVTSLGLLACKNDPPASLPEHARKSLVDFKQVEPIIQSRCIACHSCLESPCQLNMQTWNGLQRGAFHENAYDGSRVNAVPPTRMFEDASSTQAWREKGFIDVLSDEDDSIFTTALRLSNSRTTMPKRPVKESLYCPQKSSDMLVSSDKSAELAMPYGLPALPMSEQELLADWVKDGAKNAASTSAFTPNKQIQKQIQDWQSFLNATDFKSQLLARYLYEHLFLAHLYFEEEARSFYKLVRSSTSCEQAITPIATRRPNEDPGLKKWFYCLAHDPAVVVYKNHIPYPIGGKKLAWIKENFYAQAWDVSALPSYDPQTAGNPLLTFASIPVLSRYRFLLQNAQYEVMSFIKGPVCNGSFAVNSIQEQFYVFFINPSSELMVRYPDYAKEIAQQLILPGDVGIDPSLKSIASDYKKILEHRSHAREAHNRQMKIGFPGGLKLSDVWDGDGKNNNAVITVFRHDDNAKVVKGAKGDLSKTVFMLDYSTMERLVYNLVVNFDTFDNVAHQTLTRLYMDVLRMDAEDTFLYFLPPKDRIHIKRDWYQGLATNLKLKLLGENQFGNIPSGIHFKPGQEVKRELVQEILFQRMNEKVRGPEDSINWKTLKPGIKPDDGIETQLQRIASIPAKAKAFPQFFPELSFLIIQKQGKFEHVYSLIHNREHENLSWILNENSRLSPEQDTLTVLPGILGAYPNQFITVEESNLPQMLEQILSIKNKKQYVQFAKDFFVDRSDPRIWGLYDELNASLMQKEAVEAGVLDLSRYNLTL